MDSSRPFAAVVTNGGNGPFVTIQGLWGDHFANVAISPSTTLVRVQHGGGVTEALRAESELCKLAGLVKLGLSRRSVGVIPKVKTLLVCSVSYTNVPVFSQ